MQVVSPLGSFVLGEVWIPFSKCILRPSKAASPVERHGKFSRVAMMCFHCFPRLGSPLARLAEILPALGTLDWPRGPGVWAAAPHTS